MLCVHISEYSFTNNIIDTMKSVCDSKLGWCHDGR